MCEKSQFIEIQQRKVLEVCLYKENFCIHSLHGQFHDDPEDKCKVMSGKEKLTKQTQKRSMGFAGKWEAAFVQLLYQITALPRLPLRT